MKKSYLTILKTALVLAVVGVITIYGARHTRLEASSHREAPLIANDPLADNTDLYAFRSPDDTNTVTILANYIPIELPQGGPNYASFGENIRYEIHIKNDATTSGDDITYRFTFQKTNEDSTTFFNIRLGKQNLKTTYTGEKSIGGGAFATIVSNGVVPPPNIGPRSIDNSTVGLGKSYDQLMADAIIGASGGGGETIFCGPVDDPFFVDLGGIFDLGQTRAGGTGVNAPIDALACHNVHTIAIKVPISSLQKNGEDVTHAANILDGNYVIGVWASASRPQMRTLNSDGSQTDNGTWIQVSRLGMPLTNEAGTPIGEKDRWNSKTPYDDASFVQYFTNLELALYMDTSLYGNAVPGLANLRIQKASPTVLGNVNFGNGNDGLYAIYGNPATNGTALDTSSAGFGKILLQKGAPRSVDILPIFYTGVPNLAPYQLATGKTAGNPLTAGKPFINNFLPTLGDMLRLNMAVPVTPRNSPDFSSEGIVQAAVLGLTDTRFNSNSNLQFIPNMDGFPNGRRLEDDVTRIELQAVGGVALAAVGLWYDDYSIGQSPVTPDLLKVLSYTTGVEHNDTSFKTTFPYVQAPWSGYGKCGGQYISQGINTLGVGVSAPVLVVQNFPNPFTSYTNFKYHVSGNAKVTINIIDLTGRQVAQVVNENKGIGDYITKWQPGAGVASGEYLATFAYNGNVYQTIKINLVK